jgi:hypothetical protein
MSEHKRPSAGPSTHGPDCSCTRCRGFEPGHEHRVQPGNELSVKHGAYAIVKLGPRTVELADIVREAVGPFYRSSDELAVQTLALVMARIEAAEAALAGIEPGTTSTSKSADDGASARVSARKSISLETLEANLRGWVNTQIRLMDALGLTPASRAKLGLDVARTRQAARLSTLPDTEAEADEIEDGEVA